MLAFAFEFICPFAQLDEQELLTFDTFTHDIELRQGQLFLGIELRNPGDLIDDLASLEITHLHDAGHIALHHHVVTVRFDPVLCEMFDNIALLAEPVIEVVIAVIPIAGPLDPSPYLCAI